MSKSITFESYPETIYVFWHLLAECLTFKYSHNAIAILESQMKPLATQWHSVIFFFEYIYILI